MTPTKIGLALLAAIAPPCITAAAAGFPPLAAAEFELAQADSCRQTTSQLDIYGRPDRSAEVVGAVRRGDRVSIAAAPSRASGQGWTRIAVPGEGYILSRYLEACSGGSTRLEDAAALGLDDSVVGCGQVVDLGADARGADARGAVLELYSTLGRSSEARYDAIAPQGVLALGPSIQRNGRYWVNVLAYRSADPEQAVSSPTGLAWAAESGPNVPDGLRRDEAGNLVYASGRAYLDVTLVRRPCLNVFGPAIAEDQPLPDQLPRGYQTP
ncbi:MAG: hypothetical protein ACFB5Z_11830 [Elainellaceae cyanobacterium]